MTNYGVEGRKVFPQGHINSEVAPHMGRKAKAYVVMVLVISIAAFVALCSYLFPFTVGPLPPDKPGISLVFYMFYLFWIGSSLLFGICLVTYHVFYPDIVKPILDYLQGRIGD